jgi:hypothetical protein
LRSELKPKPGHRDDASVLPGHRDDASARTLLIDTEVNKPGTGESVR